MFLFPKKEFIWEVPGSISEDNAESAVSCVKAGEANLSQSLIYPTLG